MKASINQDSATQILIESIDIRYGAVGSITRADPDRAGETSRSITAHIARCFLRLANLDNGAFERANRHETALWRQVGQVLLTLEFLRPTR